MNELAKRNQIMFFRYDIIFVEKKWNEKGEEYFVFVGRAWARPDHVRFCVGWELKDLFDKSVPVQQFRFAVLKEVIGKEPIFVFVIRR